MSVLGHEDDRKPHYFAREFVKNNFDDHTDFPMERPSELIENNVKEFVLAQRQGFQENYVNGLRFHNHLEASFIGERHQAPRHPHRPERD